MKIQWARPVLYGDEENLLREALSSTFISGGPFVDRAEKELGSFHGRTAILTSSGTTAVHLALLGLGVGPGDEVIVPGWCFGAAANMVLACGAKPVFADVTDDTWLLDPLDVAKKITNRTKAIIAVHTYGNVCDMPALRGVAGDIRLIEDCAESLFAKIDGRLCGTFSDVSCFSFHATKMITSGEGGMVLADDQELLSRMRLIHSHGMNAQKKYWHHLVGYNFRLTNLQAALLCAQFGHRAKIIAQRRQVYERYVRNLRDFLLQRFNERVEPVVWTLGIRVKDRDEVMLRMAQHGIETRPGFYAFSQQPLYGALAVGRSETIAQSVICLPMPADIKLDEVDFVCEKLQQTCGGVGWLPLEI